MTSRDDAQKRLADARRAEIIKAGWDGDETLRASLGGFEQATWEIGACARNPARVHAYAGMGLGGVRNQSTWQPEIDAYRAKMTAAAPTQAATPSGPTAVTVEEVERLFHAAVGAAVAYGIRPGARSGSLAASNEADEACLAAIRRLAAPQDHGAVRDAALEEAAKVANREQSYSNDQLPEWSEEYVEGRSDASAAIARDIRALKTNTDKPGRKGVGSILVDVQRMNTTRGPDFFVRFRCGDREVTPYVFRERYKAEYEAAHFAWVFGLRPDEPDLMAYDETTHPNDAPSDAPRQDGEPEVGA